MLMSAILLTACGETKVAITADKATDNEIIVASKGKMQTSIKESFDKSYYNKDDLEKFVKDDISNFNSQNGTKVAFNSMKVEKDVLKVRGSLDKRGILGRTMDWFRVKQHKAVSLIYTPPAGNI